MNSSEAKTDFLINRISQNETHQSVDINKWAFGKINGSQERLVVLELCCGTGRQTDYLIRMFPNATISCLDISLDAVNAVKKRHLSHGERMKFHNRGIDEFLAETGDRFDLVFCSYGLYYARNIDTALARIWECLNPGGKMIIMGPYGDNNKQLFEILMGLGIKLSDAVISSSSTFMQGKVLPHCIGRFGAIHVYTTANDIVWDDVGSVLTYWKSSTFFEPAREVEFIARVEDEFAKKAQMVNTKKIMLIEAVKERS